MVLHSHAADIIYTEGGVNPNNGDNVFITGPGAAEDVILPDRTLIVSDLIEIDGNIQMAANRTDITFLPGSSPAPNSWAVMKYTGNSNRIIDITGAAGSVATGTQTLNLNNVVLMGGMPVSGQMGAALRLAGGAGVNSQLLIDGNVAFVNNTTVGAGGGAVAMHGSITFSGTSIFSGNRAGWNLDAGSFTAASGGAIGIGLSGPLGGTGQTLTFLDTAIFLSNTAGSGGGSISLASTATASKLNFLGPAVFKNNFSGVFDPATGLVAYSGGAIFLQSTNGIAISNRNAATFSGGLEMTGNRSVIDGGAVYLRYADLVINGDYLFSGNQTRNNGGAIGVNTDGGDITILGSGTFINNIAGAYYGGAIATSGNVFIGSGAVFLNNAAFGARGGAIYQSVGGRTITLSAQTDDILFRGNMMSATITGSITTGLAASGGVSNAIFINAAGTLALDAAAGRKILLEDSVITSNAGNIVLKTGAGEVVFSSTNLNNVNASTEVRGGAFVLAGSSCFTEEKIPCILGTITAIRKPSTPSPIIRTTAGYIIAETSLSVFWDLVSSYSATSISTSESLPIRSDAFTRFTYIGSK
jgi:predicted outer membrane repeat protein